MQLKVKLLKSGREEVVEVKDGSVSVLELKTILQGLFEIPAGEQSLVMRGKALLDSSNLDSYGVKDGTKLFLTHKTHTGATPTSETTPTATEVPMETGERVVLTVKLLQGGAEKQVEVASEEVTVGEVKRLVEAECSVPAHLQSLVVGGRSLEDSHRLRDYGIKSGDKLFLAQRSSPSPSTHPPSSSSSHPPPSSSWTRRSEFFGRMQAYLARHFTEGQAVLIVSKMEQQLKRQVYEVNLDSIEALAATILLRMY